MLARITRSATAGAIMVVLDQATAAVIIGTIAQAVVMDAIGAGNN